METTGPTIPNLKDGCIEQLADDLARMTERAINAEVDRDSYRLVARQLLEVVHLAITDPDGWPKHVRHYRRQHTELTQALIADLFQLEHARSFDQRSAA